MKAELSINPQETERQFHRRQLAVGPVADFTLEAISNWKSSCGTCAKVCIWNADVKME